MEWTIPLINFYLILTTLHFAERAPAFATCCGSTRFKVIFHGFLTNMSKPNNYIMLPRSGGLLVYGKADAFHATLSRLLTEAKQENVCDNYFTINMYLLLLNYKKIQVILNNQLHTKRTHLFQEINVFWPALSSSGTCCISECEHVVCHCWLICFQTQNGGWWKALGCF